MSWTEELLRFAVVKIGIDPELFWNLSWYEWALYIERHNERIEKENLNFENQWLQARTLMSLFWNANFKGKKEGSDFIKLSFDKDEDGELKIQSKPMAPTEVADRFDLAKKRAKRQKNGK